MAELPPPFLAAAVQASPIFFNKAQTLEKTAGLIHEVSHRGARMALFPEVFIPGYPRGLGFGTKVGERTPAGRDLFLTYWENSITVPGPETDQMAGWAKAAGIWLVIGVTERDTRSDTLYCSMLYFSPDEGLVHRHRKIRPTAAERIIWGEGDGRDIRVVDTELGKMGGLICWENYMPLARTALYEQGLDIYLAPTADCRDTWQSTLVHIACESRTYVIGCNQLLRMEDYPKGLSELPGTDFTTGTGGSVIISPLGKVLAGPVFGKEEILYAEIDHREIIRAKMDFDPVGHYARNDIFKLIKKDASSPAAPES